MVQWPLRPEESTGVAALVREGSGNADAGYYGK